MARRLQVDISAQDLLTIPQGGVTSQGLKHNVAVAILFIYYWLAGIGHFFYNGNVEDSATAEISRAQIWQWIRFAVCLILEYRIWVRFVDFVVVFLLCVRYSSKRLFWNIMILTRILKKNNRIRFLNILF